MNRTSSPSHLLEAHAPATKVKTVAEIREEMQQRKRAAHGQTSSPQHAFDNYPGPMGEAAFHGLAGEIVRLIEPHTEADPAAILFQILCGFGNMIGRNRYMVADGARHYLNLFGVLVGLSSKGRKGTSWNQTANVLARVDPDWRAKRVMSGLSSGEGLIWTVRDPITESKPIKEKGRHTGEYEEVVTDKGEPDKRLFIVEGEFANTLKVMERETNTLSPVIRQAWDGGVSLKTLTKTSPARSTGAHISIIGHITKDELRRLLSQTEAGNGFGNRFLWLAVKRSKCLPEGGRIDTVDFGDVVARLHDALDFSAIAGEIKRSPAAKELWHAVYPELSEGKPGMLGAVTGRAESQVMRLSALYALLDGSSLVEPQHHNAAMAFWKYCEDSARWIFSTDTGNPNADKIFVALQHTPAGMTRTEIQNQVFKRNISSDAMNDALGILQRSGRADSKKALDTGGAPSERWFISGRGQPVSPEEKAITEEQRAANHKKVATLAKGIMDQLRGDDKGVHARPIVG